jgi:hypothetical protein
MKADGPPARRADRPPLRRWGWLAAVVAAGLVLGGFVYILLDALLVVPCPHIRDARFSHVTVPVSAAPSTPEPTLPPAQESHDLDERNEARPIFLYTVGGGGMPLPPGSRAIPWLRDQPRLRGVGRWPGSPSNSGRTLRERPASFEGPSGTRLPGGPCRVLEPPVEKTLGNLAPDLPVGQFTIRKGREGALVEGGPRIVAPHESGHNRLRGHTG